MVALYTIHHLLTSYGQDEQATRLLDTRTFYILPRVSPDGAERYLTTPEMLRSSVRPWPFTEPQDGLTPADVDGDGRILQMRLVDPAGEWKKSDQDERIMALRRPDEYGGTYYRLYTEGLIENYDGYTIEQAPPKHGIDLNRNYGSSTWKGEHTQRGAGPYPFSEPESRAVAEFITGHPNIAGAMSYHTTGGLIQADSKLNPTDLRQYRELGAIGEEHTGYRCVSIYEEFTVDKANPSVGSFMDFTYDERGIITFATELWDLQQRAGIPTRGLSELMKLTPQQREEDSVKILNWVDENLPAGEGFIDWHEVDHPQLGRVEIGGFEIKYLRQNPPVRLLEQECTKNMLFTLSHAAALPQLALHTVEIDAPTDDVRVIRVVLENTGYQPTYVSEQAKKRKAVHPIKVRFQPGPDCTLIAGEAQVEIDGLAGRVDAGGRFYSQSSATGRRKKLEWVVKASAGATAQVHVRSERAGSFSETVNL